MAFFRKTDPEGGSNRYVAAGHVEGKAAIQISESGSSGGTIHHNNPFGMCLYCRHQVPTLLPAGSSLTVVGPTDAVARSPWWTTEPITLVGAPAPKPAAEFASPTPATLGVFDLHGFTEVSSPEHLDEVWQRRSNGANHYEISALPPRYPVLTVMVNHDLAVLHYFASPLGAGAQSRGTLTAAPEVAEFPDPGGGVVTLPGSTAVDVATAQQAVAQFAESGHRPTVVEWTDLSATRV